MAKQDEQQQPPPPPANDRLSIRNRILNKKTGSKIVTLADGTELEVREPSVGGTLNMAQIDDPKQRMLTLLVNHVFVPGTEERVFDPEDMEVLQQMPSSGDYKVMMEAIQDMMGLKEGVKEAAKN
jgi:hypothetical protein